MPDAATITLTICVVRRFVNVMMHIRMVPQLHEGGPTRRGQNRHEHNQVNNPQVVNLMKWNDGHIRQTRLTSKTHARLTAPKLPN